MRRIDWIVIHCAATPEGKEFFAKDIDRWHKQRGFKGIGYHYVIDLDGTIEKGRDESEPGAHVSGYNQHSIGICYIGGVDKNGKAKDTRTEAQKNSMIHLLNHLFSKYPNADIRGHRDFPKVNKACPCFDVRSEYEYFTLPRDVKKN